MCWLASCQSYEAQPLEPLAHGQAWSDQAFTRVSPGEFLQHWGHEAMAEGVEWDYTDGVSLAEGQLLGWAFNPGLRLLRMDSELAEVRAMWSGRWQDPEYSLDLLRIDENVPDRWVVGQALRFAIPTSGALAAESKLTNSEREAVQEQVHGAEWDLQLRIQEAWWSWSTAQLKAAELERYLGLLKRFSDQAGILGDAGELPSTEVNLFVMEYSGRRAEMIRMAGEARFAEQDLRMLLGVAPDAPLEFQPELPQRSFGLQASMEEVTDRNVTLARLRQAYGQAELKVQLEIKRQYPDLGLGPQVESDAGQDRFGLSFSVPLGFWNRNRKAIEEARVGRERARVAYETSWELLAGRLRSAEIRREAYAAQREILTTEMVPLVDRQLAQALRLMELGEGDSLVLLESLRGAHETKINLIEARYQEALAGAVVLNLVGPAAPAAPDNEAASRSTTHRHLEHSQESDQ
ncbi:MAG: TolC family protein [Planctomycetota bacterium]|nr:TolC family protein [Planctomycetota bacterium]